jgi:hypothetical protein
MQYRTLVDVVEVMTDDTVEWGLSSDLEEYLKSHGERGRDEILAVLDSLKEIVIERSKAIREKWGK